MKRRIGLLTSGGDCPGLNAAIRGVARAAYEMFDAEIVGIVDGYSGLINGEYREMKQSEFSGILTLGGTILGTSRQPFKTMCLPMPEFGGKTKLDMMLENYRKYKFDCLVILGGNGTHKTANLLAQHGVNVVSLPKTIRRSGHPGKGKESVRFLSAVNAQCVTSLAQTADALCSHICFIADDWGAASSLFLSALRTHALENGHDVITCYCPLSPHSKIDHLLIPGLGLAFMTENRFHNLSGLIPDRRIHAKRFLDIEVLRRHKKRLSFNQKAASQMIRQAVASLAENKALHDELESIYLQAMDFSMMDSVLESVVAQIAAATTLPSEKAARARQRRSAGLPNATGSRSMWSNRSRWTGSRSAPPASARQFWRERWTRPAACWDAASACG